MFDSYQGEPGCGRTHRRQWGEGQSALSVGEGSSPVPINQVLYSAPPPEAAAKVGLGWSSVSSAALGAGIRALAAEVRATFSGPRNPEWNGFDH